MAHSDGKHDKKVPDEKVTNDQKSDGHLHPPIALVSNASNSVPPDTLTIEDIATRSNSMPSRDRIASLSDDAEISSKPYRSVGGIRVIISWHDEFLIFLNDIIPSKYIKI